jgi:4-amino-4-deoxychorismate lyase
MLIAALIDGLTVNDANRALSIEDRGLSYGDGLFETMALRGGAVRFLDEHLARLRLGCERLKFRVPPETTLRNDIAALTRGHSEGIVKLIVTRGMGGRGYRGDAALTATRIALLYPPLHGETSNGIRLRWCATRLARNSLLAGIKHLNRLEQVLAQSEWSDAEIAEGLMLDTEGEVISATASNVFIVNDGVLMTPDLRFSGVCGVLRQHVLLTASKIGLVVEERALRPEDLLGATECFVTNALRGIRPVVALDERCWPIGHVTKRLMAELTL